MGTKATGEAEVRPGGHSAVKRNVDLSSKTGVPNLQDLMPDDLRWSSCNNMCTVNVMLLNHPKTIPHIVVGKIVFHKTGPWCQKGWGPLV